MRQTLILLMALCLPVSFIAQTNSGDLEQYVSSYIDGLPGSTGDNYQTPTPAELTSWGNMIDALLVDDLTSARTIAVGLNYQIVEYTDLLNTQLHYIVEEKIALTHYWGMFVFNADPCRSGLVIQAPHPKYDFNTGKEAGFCYTRLSARSLFISGTHRCNQSGFSVCDGSTSVCQGSSSNYQESDNAHNVQSVFQRTTESINSALSDAVFVQLHGFAKQPTDPYVIMSNGTRDAPGTDYVDMIKSGLSAADASLTFEVAHVNLAWTRLIAFTNTQGRLVNQSVDPCNTHLDISTGKFVHIEQEKTKLRDDSTGWFKMYSALSSVFACDSSTLEISIPSVKELRVFPNPISNSKLTIEGIGLTAFKLFDAKGILVAFDTFSARPEFEIEFSMLESGLYLVTISDSTRDNSIRIIKQ